MGGLLLFYRLNKGIYIMNGIELFQTGSPPFSPSIPHQIPLYPTVSPLYSHCCPIITHCRYIPLDWNPYMETINLCLLLAKKVFNHYATTLIHNLHTDLFFLHTTSSYLIYQFTTLYTIWLFNIAMEAMAHRNRWCSQLETSISLGDFPWRTVSHNQRVLLVA